MKGIDAAACWLTPWRRTCVSSADYDCDGATACAVGVRGLACWGAERGLPGARPRG